MEHTITPLDYPLALLGATKLTINKEFPDGRIVNVATLEDGTLTFNHEFKSHQIASALALGVRGYIHAELEAGLKAHDSNVTSELQITRQFLELELAEQKHANTISLWFSIGVAGLLILSWLARAMTAAPRPAYFQPSEEPRV